MFFSGLNGRKDAIPCHVDVKITAEWHSGIRQLVEKAEGIPAQEYDCIISHGKRLYKNVRDVNSLVLDGGRLTKRIIQKCPHNSAHLSLNTPPCHQVSGLVEGGRLGWTGRTSVLIHSCALHQHIIDVNLPHTATCVTFLETSGSLRHNTLHRKYFGQLMGIDGAFPFETRASLDWRSG